MKMKITKLLVKYSGLFTAFALMVGVASSADYCMIFFHQPKIPQGMNKFMK